MDDARLFTDPTPNPLGSPFGIDLAPLLLPLLLAVGLTLSLTLAYTSLVDPVTQAEISARNGASGYAQFLAADDPRSLPLISAEQQDEYNRLLREAFGPRP